MTANFRRRLIQVIVSAAILSGAVFLAMQIFSNPPKAEKKKMNKRSLVTVEVKKLATEPYRVRLQSYGKLQAKSSGSVAAQVSGVITELGDHVLVGSFFKKDELLFRIDDRDYRAALKIAEADLALAQAKLVEEQAKGEQARRNWQRLKGRESAGDLVLRKPYLASAEAAVKGAEARRDQAALDLERTAIRAPYDGRILAKNVDIGQFVSKSMVVAEIYNTHSL
ncbi:MAG: efflux RND transporter periplasmic adaptor subunit, partial [Thermodesulfobacteriota bacterium]